MASHPVANTEIGETQQQECVGAVAQGEDGDRHQYATPGWSDGSPTLDASTSRHRWRRPAPRLADTEPQNQQNRQPGDRSQVEDLPDPDPRDEQ
jgi:hypothetical protein